VDPLEVCALRGRHGASSHVCRMRGWVFACTHQISFGFEDMQYAVDLQGHLVVVTLKSED
jgi:hypothetical protein